MKTLTEFPGINLKNAAKIKQDLLAAGKTSEELPAAMGEALKLEGDRLNFLLAALELVEQKLEDLKRAVVFSLNEGEKAPHGSTQKGEQYYLVEYYPSLNKKKAQVISKEGSPGKGKGKGKRRRKGPRGGRRGEDANREGRAPGSGERPRRFVRPPHPQSGPTPKTTGIIRPRESVQAAQPAQDATSSGPTTPATPETNSSS